MKSAPCIYRMFVLLALLSAAALVRADEQPLQVDPAVAQAEQARIAAAAKAIPSVLAIFVRREGRGVAPASSFRPTAMRSPIFTSPGLAARS